MNFGKAPIELNEERAKIDDVLEMSMCNTHGGNVQFFWRKNKDRVITKCLIREGQTVNIVSIPKSGNPICKIKQPKEGQNMFRELKSGDTGKIKKISATLAIVFDDKYYCRLFNLADGTIIKVIT